ncbi:hypothetical protein FRC06_004524 [Ceratobasidium sp. 370]|nr:hypothetical protein FRC06_004524 [Ceratobasidium sp. 370]
MQPGFTEVDEAGDSVALKNEARGFSWLFQQHADPDDQSCYICEDGGKMAECTICSQTFCYGILGTPHDAEHPPCVTIPAQMADEAARAFPCPECLSHAQARSAPYIINRGARLTMRLALRSSVVLVVFYLASLKQLAGSIYDQIQASLGSFEVNLASFCSVLHQGLSEEDETVLREQLAPNAEFHLALVFVTESNPGGGWWSRSGSSSSQAAEGQFLKFLNNQVRRLARQALSVRYFGVACGWNLPGQGVVDDIQRTLTSSRVLSLVLPTCGAILPCDYAHMLPELFLNIYYFGTDLRPSLYKVWGKSEEVRTHTGLLAIDRKTRETSFSITKLLHSERASRPLGVQLPDSSSICGCWSGQEGWIYRKEFPNGRESIFTYQSECCGVEIHVAVFPSRRRTIKKNDTTFTEEDWNPDTLAFDFKESTMVRMKRFPPPGKGKDVPPMLGTPWTIAGKAAAKRRVALS